MRFVRRIDGLSYEFVRRDDHDGHPTFQRHDDDVWCRQLPEFGWVVCSSSGEVFSRPLDDPGHGALPPEGLWASAKGDKGYAYDLTFDGGAR